MTDGWTDGTAVPKSRSSIAWCHNKIRLNKTLRQINACCQFTHQVLFLLLLSSDISSLIALIVLLVFFNRTCLRF